MIKLLKFQNWIHTIIIEIISKIINILMPKKENLDIQQNNYLAN